MTKDEALKLALDALETELAVDWTNNDEFNLSAEKMHEAITAIKEALAQPDEQLLISNILSHYGLQAIDFVVDFKEAMKQVEQEPVTVLPDGSAFAVMSYPLPKDHWLYQERQYNDGEYEPVELGKPILTHEMRDAVVSAVRYAIRGATNCGKEVDFDPDALVQNAVYALCGPYTTPPQRTWQGLTDEEKSELWEISRAALPRYATFAGLIEAKLKERNT